MGKLVVQGLQLGLFALDLRQMRGSDAFDIGAGAVLVRIQRQKIAAFGDGKIEGPCAADEYEAF